MDRKQTCASSYLSSATNVRPRQDRAAALLGSMRSASWQYFAASSYLSCARLLSARRTRSCVAVLREPLAAEAEAEAEAVDAALLSPLPLPPPRPLPAARLLPIHGICAGRY